MEKENKNEIKEDIKKDNKQKKNFKIITNFKENYYWKGWKFHRKKNSF
tara:strand:- start:128 stop:271 length:144 start_codon:yes stop_codon:yes gene_type:complete